MKSTTAPVEHPTRIANFTTLIASLEWGVESQSASAHALFRGLSDLTYAEIQYYYRRRCSSRRVSKVCRFLAWALGTVGILTPLVQPLFSGVENQPALLPWGYVAFGVGGSILIFDSVFAGTNAHQRYTATQLELEKIYTVFALEWQARLIKLASDGNSESALEIVNGATLFVAELHRVLGAETSAWQESVNKALADLKGKMHGSSAGADTLAPSAVARQ